MKKKGQVSIETLLLTSIIIMMSISILGYYTRIMDDTTALEIVEIETLKQIDRKEKQYYLEEIGNKKENECEAGNVLSNVCFCIMLDPGISPVDDILILSDIKDVVVELTNYSDTDVIITQNKMDNCN